MARSPGRKALDPRSVSRKTFARFVPEVEGKVVIDLPGERVLAEVRVVVDENHIVVVLLAPPMAQGTMYRKGDVVPCERKDGPLGEHWEALDERRLPRATN
jgi:hypothetical protein